MNQSLTTITSTDPATNWQDRCPSEVCLSLCTVCVVLRPSDNIYDAATGGPMHCRSDARVGRAAEVLRTKEQRGCSMLPQ